MIKTVNIILKPIPRISYQRFKAKKKRHCYIYIYDSNLFNSSSSRSKQRAKEKKILLQENKMDIKYIHVL